MRTTLCLACLLVGLFGVPGAPGQAPELDQAREAADMILQAVDGKNVERAGRRNAGPVTRVFSDLGPEEATNYESVQLFFGDGKIEGDVRRNLIVFWGDAELKGRVEGRCVVIFGTLKLGPEAELAGETRLVGGRLIREAGSIVRNQPFELGGNYEEWPLVAGGVDWIRYGFIFGRPIAPEVPLSWLAMALCFLGYLVTAVLFPRPVQVCAYSMRTRPASAFLLGILLPIIVVLVTALLIMTGIGVLVLPFLAVAVLFATVLGKAAVLQFIGQRLGEALRLKALRSPGLALFVGGGILCLIYTVPLVGIAVWGLTVMFAMGAATLAVIDSLRAEGAVISDDPEDDPELADSLAMVHVGAGRETGSRHAPAGFWVRMGAIFLDWFIVGTISILTSAGILFVPMMFAYYVGGWAWKGTTVGGLVMSLRVVTDRGRPIGVAASLVRSLASLLSLGVFGLGFVWSVVSRDKKSWHDHIAGTNVLRVPEGMTLD